MLPAVRRRGDRDVASSGSAPEIRHPARRKHLGVSYAVTNDGLELPVLDVTHPAFACEVTEEKQTQMLARFLDERRRLARLPRWLRGALSRFFLRGSQLGRGLRRAEGGFLDGMTTYLFKLGPQNLGSYAVPIDRAMLRSLPAIAVRLRASDMARLLAEALLAELRRERARPLSLLNIGGGPATDSLNALILLARRDPSLLSKRSIAISVLDLDPNGPAFGSRALQALQRVGGPLAGLTIRFEHIAYDWADASVLASKVLAAEREGALLAASSEGGLFEYGSDQEIVQNLQALAGSGSASAFVAGSVTRDDEAIRVMKLTSTTATRPRGLALFSSLIEAAGWKVARTVARPFSDQALLVPVKRAPGW